MNTVHLNCGWKIIYFSIKLALITVRIINFTLTLFLSALQIYHNLFKYTIIYCCLMWLKFDRRLDATGWPSFLALYSAPRVLKFFLNAAVFPFHQDPKFELICVILITWFSCSFTVLRKIHKTFIKKWLKPNHGTLGFFWLLNTTKKTTD